VAPLLTYDQALAYLYSFIDYERADDRSGARFDLRRVEHVLHALGDPHLGRLTLHVAGTKGKGSTSAYLAAILQQSGFRTGLLTSPHLCAFVERIRVGGSMVSEGALAAAVTALQPFVAQYHLAPHWGRLTTFELVTITAFLCFRDAGATAQVLEVGLGGRLDATNVVPAPDVAVITPISLDHMEVLGPTVSHIAREKAGIVKPGRPVVVAPQPPEAMAVIREVAVAQRAQLFDVAGSVRWKRRRQDLGGQEFRVAARRDYELTSSLLGAVQVENAAVAVATAEVLERHTPGITAAAIRRGIASARWPGRLQVLGTFPLVIADGAQNEASARRLGKALKELTPARAIMVVGLSIDKDAAGFAAALAPQAARVIAVQSSNPRAAPAATVAGAFSARGVPAQAAATVAEGLGVAVAAAGPDGAVCVTGSLFVVGEVLALRGLCPGDVIDAAEHAYPGAC